MGTGVHREQEHLAYGTGTTRADAITLHLGHCPDGLDKIFDATRCTNALERFDADVAKLRASDGSPILQAQTIEDWPPGCYLCSNTPGCSRVSAQATNCHSHRQACMHDDQLACL